MPAFLEAKLKSEYGQNSNIPYRVMNARGFMHGNKETAKGRATGRKHAAKMRGKTNIGEMMGAKPKDEYDD